MAERLDLISENIIDDQENPAPSSATSSRITPRWPSTSRSSTTRSITAPPALDSPQAFAL
jgi:hypothetical protein